MLKLTGGLEQKIIDILWNSDTSLKPSEVQTLLNGDLAYSTIKTVLERLHEKGMLKRKKIGNAFTYSPNKTKEELASANLKDIFQGILNSYGSLAVSQFAETIKNDPEHKDLLKKFLEDNEE
jgi:predicted transcriptional regulator